MVHQLSIVTVRHCYNYKKFYVSLMVMTKGKSTIVRKRKRKKLMSIITKKNQITKEDRKREKQEQKNYKIENKMTISLFNYLLITSNVSELNSPIERYVEKWFKMVV